ncbi:MAG: hypothetical protein Q8918_19175 [Bacteroidota bacterium]|nr:hypothetical protein [Bacteroidota bacterium]
MGLQELLHADLQKKSLQAIDAASGSPDSVTTALNTYPVNDAGSSLAQDGSSDSFWLILRELRSMNEKLDVLKLLFESGLRIPDSDKSNH